jgi:toxin-antitoxin system PIN domain toxin
MTKTQLLDVNVWLALAFDSHAHHAKAKAWFDGLTGELCHFCRMTQQGFLRLAANPKVFGPDARTLDEAWELYDLFLSDPRVTFAAEPPGLEPQWRLFTGGRRFAPNLWNDAYLAAFAVAGGYELVTFDHGFSQYPGLAFVILT